MKTRALILATVIAFVISSSWPSFADVPTQAALTLAAALGSTVLVSGAAVEGLLPFELSDWKDDRTDSTTQLSQDCTTYSEVRVIGTSRKNFILLGLRNTSMETRYLKFGEIRIAFSTDRERNADLVSKGQDYEFKPNELVVGLIPMPEKSDFKKAEWLEVVVPILMKIESSSVLCEAEYITIQQSHS